MRVSVIAVDSTHVVPTAKVRAEGSSDYLIPIDKGRVSWWGARIGTEVLLNPTEVPA